MSKVEYVFPRRLSRFGVAGLLSAAIVLAPTGASAGTATTSFSVTATVLAACVVTANNLGFGSYDPGAAVPLEVNTTLSVTCTNGTPYNVRLNSGSTSGATVATRQMANGVNRLNYGLFRDAAYAQNWGQTDGVDTSAGTGTGAAVAYTVYGKVPVNQYLPPATYTDSVTVTVFF